MRKIFIPVCALMGLSACAVPESVQQSAIASCLQVGITQSDPQFPVCARSYALQKQDAALNQNFNLQEDMREQNLQDRRVRRREDVFR